MVRRRNTRIGRMIYLGLGSNVGDRLHYLRQAVASLRQNGIDVIRCSCLYESVAWGEQAQASYLNAAVEVNTRMAPSVLLGCIKLIEQRLGRIPTYTWGPREIDLDILEYHSWQVVLPDLKIPHPYITKRAFVLQPMLDLLPQYVPVGQSITGKQWLERLEEGSLLKISDTDWYELG